MIIDNTERIYIGSIQSLFDAMSDSFSPDPNEAISIKLDTRYHLMVDTRYHLMVAIRTNIHVVSV